MGDNLDYTTFALESSMHFLFGQQAEKYVRYDVGTAREKKCAEAQALLQACWLCPMTRKRGA